MTLTATVAGNINVNKKNSKIYAGEDDTVYFAEGFGTGVDFDNDNDSWVIKTAFRSGTPDYIQQDDEYKAGIVKNEHSGNNESIIRLINGVRNSDLSSPVTDYRVGQAMVKNKITMKEDSQFSAKFTISMPDACVNSEQTGGEQHAREVGGDGIAFIITTTEDFQGQAGAGMGYYGVNDSLVVEMDSYFNGAYATFEQTDTGYVNWGYDNQIYANSELTFLSNLPDTNYRDYDPAYNYGAYWDNVLNPSGYEQLSGSRVRRFDHVGVMLDGVTGKHVGISYLNGLDPAEVENGKYKNITEVSASTPETSSTCATRFTDEGTLSAIGEEVDNRLFTVWIEYDGENLYVRYANGNFVSAVRPAEPQIAIVGDARLAQKFAHKDVKIGFTSSIGSSKANHTVHSIAFVNEYMPDGITTEYTQVYYVEKPDATEEDNYITVGEKKYVLSERIPVTGVSHGSSATIVDKSSDNAYKTYKLVDYSDNPLYPKQVDTVRADGATVLYQFYDLTPKYQIIYYTRSVSDDSYSIKETSEIFTGTLGSEVTAEEADSSYRTKYEPNYTLSTTKPQEDSVTLSDTANVYLIKLYYDPMAAYYKLNYHKWDSDIQDYVLTDSTQVMEGFCGKQYTITDADPNYGTKYENYEVNTTKNEEFSVTLTQEGEIYEMNVYYDPVEAGYKLNYYKLNPNTNEYEFIESTGVKQGELGKTYRVTDADASYVTKYTSDGYVVNENKNEDYTVTLENMDRTYELKVYYVPVKTSYITEYWLEQQDGTFKLLTDDTVYTSDVYAGKDVLAVIKDYTGYRHTITDNTNESDTVKADGSTTLKVYYTIIITEYKEQYLIEDPNAESDYIEIVINGEIKKFVLSQTNDVNDVQAGTGATVTDKSNEYANYELVQVEVPGFPSSVDEINPDGTTVVYQGSDGDSDGNGIGKWHRRHGRA